MKRYWLHLMLLALALGLGYIGLRNTEAGTPYIQRPYMAGQDLLTPAKPWKELRTPAAETAAAAYATTDDLSFYTIVAGSAMLATDIGTNITSTNGLFDVFTELGWGTNAVTIAFYVNGPNDVGNDTFDFQLYAWKDSIFGPAMPVYITASNACKAGTYDCDINPIDGSTESTGQWVDTISGTDCWPADVTISDSTNNRLCTMTFDLMGSRYLLLRVFDALGGGTEAQWVGAVITGY